MTRHGTLAYYLAAWVIGCFIVALLFSIAGDSVRVSLFLMTYFFALMGGVASLLLFAFLLRRAMRYLNTHNLAVWAVMGTAIFSALVYLLALASEKRPEAWWIGVPLTVCNFILGGAEAVRRTGFWQAPIDGAATAVILCMVDRAFANMNDRPEAASETKQSPA
jgi:hypothetical protein